MENLKGDLNAAGFSDEKMAEALEMARTLTADGQPAAGRDDDGHPYRIARHGLGYEFETDADIS